MLQLAISKTQLGVVCLRGRRKVLVDLSKIPPGNPGEWLEAAGIRPAKQDGGVLLWDAVDLANRLEYNKVNPRVHFAALASFFAELGFRTSAHRCEQGGVFTLFVEVAMPPWLDLSDDRNLRHPGRRAGRPRKVSDGMTVSVYMSDLPDIEGKSRSEVIRTSVEACPYELAIRLEAAAKTMGVDPSTLLETLLEGMGA